MVSAAFLGPLAAFLSSVTWAIGTSGYSKLSRSYSPFAVNFTRALIGLPFFFVLTFIVAGGLEEGVEAFSKLGLRHLGWFSLSMVASYGLGDVLFLWSTRSLGVPGALAIASGYPIFAALADVIVLGNAVTLRQVAGLLVTVAGMITVILNVPRPAVPVRKTQDVVPESRLSRRGVGVALALATCFFWALNSFCLAQGGTDVSSPVANTLRMILAMGISMSFGSVLARGMAPVLPLKEIRTWAWLFAVEACAGAWFFMYGLANSPLVIGVTLSSLAPVLAVPIAVFAGLERLSFPRTAGVTLVVLGLWLLVGATAPAAV